MLITECEKYVDLLNEFPPYQIRSEQELMAVQKVVDALLDAKQLSGDQKEYLNLLGMIIGEYEDKNVNVNIMKNFIQLAQIAILKQIRRSVRFLVG